MSDEEPRLGRTETLGEGTPGTGERAEAWAASHRILAGLLAAAAVLALVGAATAWWRSRPQPVQPQWTDALSAAITSTGMGGVVKDAEGGASSAHPASASTLIELKVALQGPIPATGTVRGLTGPGVTASTPSHLPPVRTGSSTVGIVATTLDCATASADPGTYTLVLDVSDQHGRTGAISAPLGGVQTEWAALVTQACGLAPLPT